MSSGSRPLPTTGVSLLSTPCETRPPAFIHVDCDGLWAVEACYGPPRRVSPEGDPFWLEGLPAALDLLAASAIPATFFVISRDLRVAAHRDLVLRAIAQGHEIASHSAAHPVGMRRAPLAAVRDEVARSRAEIAEATGQAPLGFRSPGFSFRRAMAPIVRDAGFLYDSSVFASFFGPLLRAARRFLGRRSAAPQHPYGGWREIFTPRGPWWIVPPDGQPPLLEIPVSLTPALRLPAHATFALTRSDASFRALLDWHARRGLPFVWLIHLIDVCDTANVDLPVPRWVRDRLRHRAEDARARLRAMLGQIRQRFVILRTDRWAASERDRL